jgi:shikimate dehydrogenase
MRCGLLGRTLGHSYSPQIHGALADYGYDLFEKEPEELEAFLKNGDFHGLNVTIPYKKAVIAHCDALSPTARKLGAVNTIVRQNDGTLIGHNTDYFGFRSMLERSKLQVSGKKALVLGSGGASATAVAVLQEMGAKVVVISRNGENNYQNLHLHVDAAVIVNATPVGMYPKCGTSAVSLDLFPALEGVLDLIYNPAKTKILLDAEERGLVAVNGLWMLVAQAKESSEWFSGNAIADTEIAKIYTKLRSQMENIILIGMPGCGKSTVGKLISQKLGRKFVDADAEISKRGGKSIPEIFAEQGEDGFRALETQVLAELGTQSGFVIATGGGCVTRQENYRHLHQNGVLFWLQREISALPTDGRPLSANGKLEEMYRIRKPMYQAFSDHVVRNTTPEAAALEIIEIMGALT